MAENEENTYIYSFIIYDAVADVICEYAAE